MLRAKDDKIVITKIKSGKLDGEECHFIYLQQCHSKHTVRSLDQ